MIEEAMTNIDEEKFTDVEIEILELLKEGRCTPSYIADELDVSREYVQSRLRELERLNLIRKIHRGLYELETDEN